MNSVSIQGKKQLIGSNPKAETNDSRKLNPKAETKRHEENKKFE